MPAAVLRTHARDATNLSFVLIGAGPRAVLPSLSCDRNAVNDLFLADDRVLNVITQPPGDGRRPAGGRESAIGRV